MIQRSLFILILATGISFGISAQRIIAGMHGSQDYYYNFLPDIILTSTSGSFNVTYSLDINNDGINDLTLGAQHEVTNWEGATSSYLISLNQTGFALERFDSCFAIFDSTLQYHLYYVEPIAKSFSKYDTIGKSSSWYPGKLYMAYSRGSVNKPWNQGYGCGGMMDTTQTDYYVGVRVLIPNDTLYGWVKIRFTYLSVTIEEYGCNKYSIGMDDPLNESFISIFPNPTNGQLFIRNSRFGRSDCNVKVFDVLGESIYESELNTEKTTIDLSEKPKGVYVVKLYCDNESITKKVIVQ